MLAIYKAISPRQLRIIPTRNIIKTASIAGPEKFNSIGSLRINFSMMINNPMIPEIEVITKSQVSGDLEGEETERDETVHGQSQKFKERVTRLPLAPFPDLKVNILSFKPSQSISPREIRFLSVNLLNSSMTILSSKR